MEKLPEDREQQHFTTADIVEFVRKCELISGGEIIAEGFVRVHLVLMVIAPGTLDLDEVPTDLLEQPSFDALLKKHHKE